MTVNKKTFLAAVLINSILILLAVFTSANIIFTLTVITWVNLICFALSHIEKRSMLFAFLISFFTFLLGRDFLEVFFKYKVEAFSNEINNHAYICYLVSLVTIGISYTVIEKFRKFQVKIDKQTSYSDNYTFYLRKVSFYIFILSLCFAIVSKLVSIRYIGANGYYDYYADFSEYLAGNTLLYAITKVELCVPIALSIYMGTLPSKTQFKRPMMLYGLYMVISLLTGQRSTFMLGCLWFIVYFLFRNGTDETEEWFPKKYFLFVILVFPAIAILSSVMNVWRQGGVFEVSNFWDSFIGFFYDQGTSSNAVKRAFEYADRIPSGFIYSFEFLRSGILARILGIPIYHGNTVEHALYGGSFTHALGYVVMGTNYLAGQGPGSSYIAELFYDFQIGGVIVGSIIYSWLFVNISNIAKKSPLVFSACLAMITQLLWAPRGSFSGFISIMFYPTTWFTFIVVFFLAKLFVSASKN